MDGQRITGWLDNGGRTRRITKSSVEKMLSQRQDSSDDNMPGENISIVVVEDNEQEQKLYTQQFDNWNMNVNVYMAKDGYAGLIYIGKTSPAIIITDLMMPDMNGFEMIKAIKENPDLEHCRIIAVSALTKDEIRTRGGLPPDVVVFSKPMPFNELENIIRNQVNSNVA